MVLITNVISVLVLGWGWVCAPDSCSWFLVCRNTLSLLHGTVRPTDAQREVSKIICVTSKKKNILLKKIATLIKEQRGPDLLAFADWESSGPSLLKASDLSGTDQGT